MKKPSHIFPADPIAILTAVVGRADATAIIGDRALDVRRLFFMKARCHARHPWLVVYDHGWSNANALTQVRGTVVLWRGQPRRPVPRVVVASASTVDPEVLLGARPGVELVFLQPGTRQVADPNPRDPRKNRARWELRMNEETAP